MQTENAINSGAYWDTRFFRDWETLQGPDQSRFFSRIAIENMPRWLFDELRRQPLTLCDWGCALGDGTGVWASYIDSERLTGVDFSLAAIEQARQRYPTIQFLNENWLEIQPKEATIFDVVFSSNTLEHFHKPYDVLKILCSRSAKAVVLAIPYMELDRHREHFYTFLPSNIPAITGDGFRMVWSKVVDCRHLPSTHWGGDQIILVYAKSDWVDGLDLTLQDFIIEQSDRAAAVLRLQYAVAEHERQISNLNKALAERDAQIYSLDYEITKMKNSTSWRITSPIRWSKSVLLSILGGLYSAARSVYWRLPSGLRSLLNRPRHFFVRRVKRIAELNSGVKKELITNDLTWEDFQRRILVSKDRFKGVFIQDSVIEWDMPMYQRPQHIAVALGRLGYLVLYKTGNSFYDDVNGFREVASNVWLTDRSEIYDIHGAVRSFYSGVVDVLPKEDARSKKSQVWVYEYVDQIDEEISGDRSAVKKLIDQKQRAFSGAVDFIVSSAKKLHQEAIQFAGADRALLIPNGVDVLHYRDPRHVSFTVSDEMLDFKRNHKAVVGYFGAIAPWLWHECIHQVVKMNPELGFVFIGIDYLGGVNSLPTSSNVLYLGPVDYKVLPAYAQKFDVCFIPFKPGDIAKTTSPLKLFEYFALEKPVVVTSDMNECVGYPEVFRGGSAEELSCEISRAISIKDDESFKMRLRELADENEWLQRAKAYEVCFGERAS